MKEEEDEELPAQYLITAMEHIKAVVVGDGNVGKTSLILTYTSGVFDEDHIPTTEGNYATNMIIKSIRYHVGLWDTAGQEEYNSLRALSYPQSDLFLLCFSVNNRTSFSNVKNKWLPELDYRLPEGCAKILVGTKADLRQGEEIEEKNDVKQSEALEFVKEKGLDGYFECSAKTGSGIREAFEGAVLSAVEVRNQKLKDMKRCRFISMLTCSIM